MVREFLAVVVRAVIQWAVATLLLANGAAFCLIAAVSEQLRLGPPCILCARVHRLLCSPASAGDGRDALRLLLCDAHLAAVADAGPERSPCHVPDRSSAESREELDADDRDKVSGLESQRVVSIGSEICEQDQDTNGISNTERAGSADDGNGHIVSLFELEPILAHPRDDSDHTLHKVTRPPPELQSVEGGERLTVGQLLSLRAQRRELDALREELDAERRALVAAEEYQRQLEEQGELDREAARLAMELVHETEREKQDLQRQLNACRVGAQIHGGGGDNNNYQSLVDCLPGTLYSSSPDLANLLKLYNEPGNGDRRQREGFAPAVTVVDEEVEEEDVAVAVTDVIESSVSVDASVAVVGDPLHERKYTSSHVEAVTEGA